MTPKFKFQNVANFDVYDETQTLKKADFSNKKITSLMRLKTENSPVNLKGLKSIHPKSIKKDKSFFGISTIDKEQNIANNMSLHEKSDGYLLTTDNDLLTNIDNRYDRIKSVNIAAKKYNNRSCSQNTLLNNSKLSLGNLKHDSNNYRFVSQSCKEKPERYNWDGKGVCQTSRHDNNQANPKSKDVKNESSCLGLNTTIKRYLKNIINNEKQDLVEFMAGLKNKSKKWCANGDPYFHGIKTNKIIQRFDINKLNLDMAELNI